MPAPRTQAPEITRAPGGRREGLRLSRENFPPGQVLVQAKNGLAVSQTRSSAAFQPTDRLSSLKLCSQGLSPALRPPQASRHSLILSCAHPPGGSCPTSRAARPQSRLCSLPIYF